MSEVIEIYGAQIGPPLSYLIALTPIIVVFVVAFAVAWGWRVHVETKHSRYGSSSFSDDCDGVLAMGSEPMRENAEET